MNAVRRKPDVLRTLMLQQAAYQLVVPLESVQIGLAVFFLNPAELRYFDCDLTTNARVDSEAAFFLGRGARARRTSRTRSRSSLPRSGLVSI